MAGTNRKATPILGGPAVILVRPQLGENIGAASRAMLNFGLTALRLVAPRDGWPNPAALAMASGADKILEAAVVFDTLEAALADRSFAVATTARERELEKTVLEPGAAAGVLRTRHEAGEPCALIFGPEAAGLTSDEAALADLLVTIPTNPAFASLNLGQAVLILGYAWFNARPRPSGVLRDVGPPANRALLFGLFEHLERELERMGFLHPPEKKPAMVRNLRAMLTRANFTEQDIRTLRGVIAALTGAKLKR
jgi:tRNA/rRNA methyltransferase